MKNKACKIISVICSAAFLFCSCHENTEPVITPESDIFNGNSVGIQFDTSPTAQTAVPIPQIDASYGTDTSVSSEETPDESSETTSEAITSLSSAESVTTTTEKQTTTTSRTAVKTTTTTAVTTVGTTTATSAPVTTTIATTTTTKPSVYAPSGEVRGVWISYLEIGTLLKNKTEADFRTAVKQIYSNCASLGINTVYVHARAYGDAFYDSDLFPFTKYISGNIGVKVSYDPYEILVSEAKKQGLSFHAWINPLRLCTAEDMKLIKSGYTIRDWYDDPDLKGKYIVNVNGTWYLNPAYDETIKLICDGVKEILKKYDVDGIHIDDYFYPTTDASFDSSAFSNSGYSTLSAFRINNCNKLVKGIYNTVHNNSAGAVFGASTQGSFQNNLNQMYADVEAWCKGGYVDYLAPQIYYGFDNGTQPFEACTSAWKNVVKNTNIKLYIGLAVYKVGAEDKWAGNGRYEWCNTETMLKRQTEYARKIGCNGIVLYSYNYIFTSGYANNATDKEIANLKPLLK